MTTPDGYIKSVIEQLPRGGSMRSHIARELEAHIAERVASGRALEDVLRQLGKPKTLAESYLGVVPLVAAPLLHRVAAKIADIGIVVVAVTPVLVLGSRSLPPELAAMLVVATLVAASLGFGVYTIGAEYWMGQTLGKHFMGLRVVQESGAAIGLGRALVRQLPMLLQFYWIDVLFAFFTERQQRAFELLSKTRVVLSDPPSAPSRNEDDGPSHA